MINALSAILLIPAIIVLAVTLILSIEILGACISPRPRIQDTPTDFPGKIAVLVPAHNEQMGIAKTLRDIKTHLGPPHRLIVVADNCTDDTAAIANALEAEVTQRFDTAKRGKGYALDWGLAFLASDPPDIVIVIDADCHIADNALISLATEAARLNRPVQARYVMAASEQSSIGQQVGEFAWLVKNYVRPLGLKSMNLPCQLMGTGMAFPWKLISSANLANGHIVEDLKLGLDLARLGWAPKFHPQAIVSSTFPSSVEGMHAQRQRWEHGHIYMIGSVAISLFCRGIASRDINLTALSLDLLVPPVSLLGFVILVLLAVSGVGAVCGLTPLAFILSVGCLFLLATSITLAWLKFGSDVLPAKSLLQVPAYIWAKLPSYAKLVLGRGVSNWVRSDRL
jgi:cellulose synthase/poly-beta-1,6-N-acetylglucosamine synthase-like glycosyltransferase